MIKAILFDFGQTLVDSANGFRQAEKIAKAHLFAELFPDSNEDLWATFLKVYRRLRTLFHQRSNFSRPAIWEAVYRRFDSKANFARLEKWETAYWATVKSHTRPFPETLEVLETLSKSFRLGLITNTQGQKSNGEHRIALFPEMERFFTAIIVAGEGDIPPKPDPKPFGQCLERLDVSPAQAVFVGDDWRIDVQGAVNAGLRPVWIKHHSVNRRWPKVEPPEGQPNLPVITKLDQLPELVKTFNQ